MLKNPLPISFVGRPSTDRVSLNNVLVVHKMPVPFHLSTKGDNHYIIDVGREAFNFSYSDPLKYDWRKHYRRVFPERYHSHPYFKDNHKIYIAGI